MKTVVLLIAEFFCFQLCLCQLKQSIIEEGDMFRFSCDVTVNPQRLMFDPVFFAVTKGDVMTGLAINTRLEPNNGFQLNHFSTGPENKTFVIEISKRVTLTDSGNYTCGTKVQYHKTETLKVMKGDIGEISLTLRKIDQDVISGPEVTVNRDSGIPDLPLHEVNLTSGTYKLVCATRRQDLSISYVILINGIKIARTATVDVDLGSEDRNVACRVRTTDKFTDTHTLGFSTNVHEGFVPTVSCLPNFWVKGKRDEVECRVSGVACEAISLDTDMLSTGQTNDAMVLSCQTNRTRETLSSILQISDTSSETLFIKVRSQLEDFRFEIKTGIPPRYDALASTADITGSHYSFIFKAVVTTLLMLPIATFLEMVIM
ncbi:uncharacterized protein LOC110447443 [Mizuhopecten yessoensis]|uniref:Ig-like domain-containing protein n=1 Tax=Mizuhopecten yessoensis TaxID=6573 RepID=A0A210QVC4_MIZYE|nr:uncharacterized protein LOC110447443 [Mizuhopecten yessoensis]OWF52687.1 hypothetical protein KP79_PYT00585 [Mizuhopecten yessoensis]